MTLTREDPELERPLEDPEQLVDFFRAGEKPPSAFRVGTEHEKIGLLEPELAPVPYEGRRGIASLLEELAAHHGFGPLRDGGLMVGLERDATTITLEPGGQLELSGAPLRTLHETCREFQEHLAQIKHVSEPLGIVWLGLGVHPLARLVELPRMPRERYTLMRRYMEKAGTLGLHMMHATGSVQASFDYASEADLARKLRTALALSPVVTALYANASVSEGEPNGFESFRAQIWRHTDPLRCGLLPFAFDEGWGEGTAYRRYAEWALEAPMLFVVRGERHVDLTGRSFREYFERGAPGLRPRLSDWNVHLTTLFPEVRLKRVLEVRGADAVPPALVCALPAFWKGIFYDAEALATAGERVAHWKYEDVDRLHARVARTGIDAETPDGPLQRVAREILDLAAAGLRRIGDRNRSGQDERLFLDPLFEILERGASPGRQVLEHWHGAWSRRIGRLVEYAKY